MGDLKKVGGALGGVASTVAPFIPGWGIPLALGGLALSGLGRGHTQQFGGAPGDVQGLRTQLIQQLMSGLPGSGVGSFGMGQGAQGLNSAALDPYRKLFTQTRADTLGQAKEAAGNLTGSGYNNILGSAAATSLAQENAQLSDVGLRMQQMQQQQQQSYLNALLGLTTQQSQVGYQPGFLDYLFQGASAAAPFFVNRNKQTAPAPYVPTTQPTTIYGQGGGYQPFGYGQLPPWIMP